MRWGGSGCELERGRLWGFQVQGARPRIGEQPSAVHACVSMGHSQGVGHLVVEPQGLKKSTRGSSADLEIELAPPCARAGARLWHHLRMLVPKLKRILWFS